MASKASTPSTSPLHAQYEMSLPPSHYLRHCYSGCGGENAYGITKSLSLSLSLSLFHNLRTNTTRGTRLPRFSPPHPHPSLTSGFCFLIADCHWRHFFRKTLEVVESSSGENFKSKILYNDTTTWIRSKCMHCRICPTNPTL